MIPESFIQELLNRVDIVDVIDRHVHLKKAGANYAACCPFHHEKTPSFTVSPSKQFYHCFGCGAHGTAISFLMEYAGLGFIDAVKELAQQSGLQVPDVRTEDPQTKRQTQTLTEIMATASRYYYEQLKRSTKAIEYLKGRGISGEVAQKFSIGYAPDGWQNLATAFASYNDKTLQAAGLVIQNDNGRLYDRFRDRIMFPIINQKGETIAFGGRVLGAGEPKYLNSPETPLFEKGHEVFGLPQARNALREHNITIVVEGYMDVIALAQHGVGNVVATLGTATTPTHVQKLFRQTDRIVYCFDGDNAGRKAAWRALENSLEALPEQKSIGFVFLPNPEDPDSYIRTQGAESFSKLIKQAQPLSEFLIRELGTHCDLASAEGRAKLVADAKPYLLKLKSPILRLQITKELAAISQFSTTEVEKLCQLKPISIAAPAKTKRQAPSIYRPLLRAILQAPKHATRIPRQMLPNDNQEAAALHTLCTFITEHPELAESNYATLLVKLENSPLSKILQDSAAELLHETLDESEIESTLNGAIERIEANHTKRRFAALQEKVTKLGVSGLSADEKLDYLHALKASTGADKTS